MTMTEVDYFTYTMGNRFAYQFLNDLSAFGWNEALKEALPAVLNGLADYQRDSGTDLANVSAEWLGAAFGERMRNVSASSFTTSPGALTGYGQWLVDHADAAQRFDPDEFPPPGTNVTGHSELEVLLIWARNLDGSIPPPLVDSVDRQAMLLKEAGRWMSDGCEATAEAKAYLSLVMRYKRARIARHAAAEVVEPPTQPTMTNLELTQAQQQISSLEDLVASLRGELTRSQDAHRSDVERIGNALLEQARRREWCAEYDDFVNELNATLSVELPTRMSEYQVTWTERYYVTVERSTTVEANNTEDARENVENGDYIGQAESSDLVRAIRYDSNYGYDDDDEGPELTVEMNS